jgi:hypothetical protein
MSSGSSVNDALTGYAAGRLTAEQLVGVVAAAYYGNRGEGRRERLRPVMDVIERAHPGIVELAGTPERPGFSVKLADRPFPKQWERALREAAAQVAGTESNISPLPSPGFFTRVLRAIRRVFSA